MPLPPSLREALTSIYEEIMWLSRRPNVTPGRARSWYTHIMAETVKRQIRKFSGKVSVKALAAAEEPLTLEHYKRIQTTLSELVERHRREAINDLDEFLSVVVEYEQVHIVTRSENYAAMRSKGDYDAAQIELRSWETIALPKRQELWRKMLRGKVANSSMYAPTTEA